MEQASGRLPDTFPQLLMPVFATAIGAAAVAGMDYVFHFGYWLDQSVSPDTVGVQVQHQTLRAAKEEFHALQDAATQDRFAAQFSAFVTLLADLKGRDTYPEPVNDAGRGLSAWIKEGALAGDDAKRIRRILDRAVRATFGPSGPLSYRKFVIYQSY